MDQAEAGSTSWKNAIAGDDFGIKSEQQDVSQEKVKVKEEAKSAAPLQNEPTAPDTPKVAKNKKKRDS